jgi:hypothetical protein
MGKWLVALIVCLSLPSTALAQAGPAPAPPAGPVGTALPGSETQTQFSRADLGDVALTTAGRAEFVLSAPVDQAEVATAALEARGAQLLRFRDLDQFGLRIAIFDLRGLSPDAARAALATTAPGARIDGNHLYRFTQGAAPRVYAPALVGHDGRCRLARPPRIGIIDGPVDRLHPALDGATIVQQTALLPGQTPADRRHGTAVASLIVGIDSGGVFAGFASGAPLYAATAFARDRRSGGVAADVDRIAAALDWMLAARVQVINMSFAGPYNAVFDDLLSRSARRGAVLVAAAGNAGRDQVAFPAASADVIAVTAIDAALRPYRQANRGAEIEFAAPGVDIYVAEGRGGAYASGTSYAAPIVAALAARHVARGAKGATEVRAALRASVRRLGDRPRDPRFGWGLVRAPSC